MGKLMDIFLKEDKNATGREGVTFIGLVYFLLFVNVMMVSYYFRSYFEFLVFTGVQLMILVIYFVGDSRIRRKMGEKVYPRKYLLYACFMSLFVHILVYFLYQGYIHQFQF